MRQYGDKSPTNQHCDGAPWCARETGEPTNHVCGDRVVQSPDGVSGAHPPRSSSKPPHGAFGSKDPSQRPRRRVRARVTWAGAGTFNWDSRDCFLRFATQEAGANAGDFHVEECPTRRIYLAYALRASEARGLRFFETAEPEDASRIPSRCDRPIAGAVPQEPVDIRATPLPRPGGVHVCDRSELLDRHASSFKLNRSRSAAASCRSSGLTVPFLSR